MARLNRHDFLVNVIAKFVKLLICSVYCHLLKITKVKYHKFDNIRTGLILHASHHDESKYTVFRDLAKLRRVREYTIEIRKVKSS